MLLYGVVKGHRIVAQVHADIGVHHRFLLLILLLLNVLLLLHVLKLKDLLDLLLLNLLVQNELVPQGGRCRIRRHVFGHFG